MQLGLFTVLSLCSVTDSVLTQFCFDADSTQFQINPISSWNSKYKWIPLGQTKAVMPTATDLETFIYIRKAASNAKNLDGQILGWQENQLELVNSYHLSRVDWLFVAESTHWQNPGWQSCKRRCKTAVTHSRLKNNFSRHSFEFKSEARYGFLKSTKDFKNCHFFVC